MFGTMTTAPPGFVPFQTGDVEQSIGERFAAQARRHAERIAIATGDATITYRDLDDRSDRVAAGLIARGAQPGARIAILAEQGAAAVTITLGILKAGCAFVPLDPALSDPRCAAVLDDAQAMVVVADDANAQRSWHDRAVVALDALAACDMRRGDEPRATASSVASIYYTSGSSGPPKGVAGDHRSILHNVLRYTNSLGLAPADRLSLIQSPVFSGVASSLFGAVLNGATLCPFDLRGQGFGALARWVDRLGITVFHAVPSIFEQLCDSDATLASLRLVRLEGDRAAPRHVEMFARRCPAGSVLVNGLGTTETGLVAQFFVAHHAAHAPSTLPVGWPTCDVELVVADESGAELPDGAAGRLIIRSPYLARGYWRRPELTAACFGDLEDRPGWRWFRSEDLARRRPDGAFEVLGRRGSALRLDGRPIDADAIEARLAEAAEVAAAVVAVRSDGDAPPRLVAYLVPRPGMAPARRALQDLLATAGEPVPSIFVLLDQLPLSEHGKLDRGALPAPAPANILGEEVVATPRDPLEAELARLWSAALGQPAADVEREFMALGGDSLRAAALVADIEARFGVRLPLDGPFRSVSTIARMAAAIRAAPAIPASRDRPRDDGEALAPLCFSQERMWFAQLLRPDSPAYNVPLAMRLRGALDVARLETALTGVVDRHPALRSRIVFIDGQPRQAVSGAGLAVVHRNVGAAGEFRAIIEHDARQPFDLASAPLCRATLIRLASDDHVLLLVVHHIAFDDASAGIVMRELGALYRGETLPAPMRSHVDYARADRAREGDVAWQEDLDHWRRTLTDAPRSPALAGPARREAADDRGGTVRRRLPAALGAQLAALARHELATPFMAYLAGFVALLARHSGERDIVVGGVIGIRPDSASAGTVGVYANTVALRVQIEGDLEFRLLLRRVREIVLDAIAHGRLPFQHLVAALAPMREPETQPLVQIGFASARDAAALLELPQITVEPIAVGTGTAKFDLNVVVTECMDGPIVTAEYATSLFDAARIEDLVLQYERLLGDAVRRPDAPIARLELHEPAELDLMLRRWNATDRPVDATTLDDLIAAGAARDPDKTAIRHGAASISYRRLDAAAATLAAELMARGAGRAIPVAICLERSIAAIIAMLAVLRCASAYVPLDTRHASDRLVATVVAARAVLVITTDDLASVFAASPARCLLVDPETLAIATPPAASVARHHDAGDLAVVFFTSGSTGEPKGVAVEHRSIVNLLRDGAHAALTCDDVVAQICSLAFDLVTFEIWLTLARGATLVILDHATVIDAPEFAAAIARECITAAVLPTAIFHRVVEHRASAFGRLRVLWLCGEAAKPERVRAVLGGSRRPRIFNAYGPTEATTFVTIHEIDTLPADARDVPIGRPIANARVFVLDDRLAPAPMGAIGEICIGGVPLARGYLHRPDLTALAFVPAPFDPALRLYRTGDRGRFRRDGVLEFIGRIDDQVKIRGVRVEPAEARAAIEALPDVSAAAVASEIANTGERQLVAFVVADAGARDETALRRALRRRVPDFLVPSRIRFVAELPLTANGKVDVGALLRDPDREAGETRAITPPVNLAEFRLMRLWADLLGNRAIGLDDDFFALGGHSLLAAHMIQQVEALFGRRVSLAAFMTTPTIAGLVERLEADAAPVAGADIIEVERGDGQAGLFFIHSDFNGGFFCRALSRALGSSLPFHALPPHGTDDRPVPESIEAMAAIDAAAIRRVQAHGPYFIAGHCAGALRALEAGRVLRRQNQDVAMVAMIDATSVNASRWVRRIARIARGAPSIVATTSSGVELFRRLRHVLRGGPGALLKAIFRRSSPMSAGPSAAMPDPMAALTARNAALHRRYLELTRAYVPQSWAGELVCLISAAEARRPLCDPGPWRSVADHVDLEILPGDHFSILTVNADGLLAALRRRLAARRRADAP